jgi:hypothetical protein
MPARCTTTSGDVCRSADRRDSLSLTSTATALNGRSRAEALKAYMGTKLGILANARLRDRPICPVVPVTKTLSFNFLIFLVHQQSSYLRHGPSVWLKALRETPPGVRVGVVDDRGVLEHFVGQITTKPKCCMVLATVLREIVSPFAESSPRIAPRGPRRGRRGTTPLSARCPSSESRDPTAYGRARRSTQIESRQASEPCGW